MNRLKIATVGERLQGPLVLFFLSLSSLAAIPTHADDSIISAGVAKAQALFDQRNVNNLKPTQNAIELLKNLEGRANHSDINYEILILETRALYWNGEHTPSSQERLSIFLEGQEKAKAAREINDRYADAYYYGGIHLARWAETTGIVESISRKGELVDSMNETIQRSTLAGGLGENIDGDGPNRVLGRLYFKLPWLLGGSYDKSVQYLRKAIDDNQKLNFYVPLNNVFYAETLSAGSSDERRRAKQILDQLLSQDPKVFNPSRVPENLDEFDEARKLLTQL